MTDRGSEVHEAQIGNFKAMARQASRIFSDREVQAGKVERISEIQIRHYLGPEGKDVSRPRWIMPNLCAPAANISFR